MSRTKNIETIKVYRNELAQHQLNDQSWVDDIEEIFEDEDIEDVAKAYAVVFNFEDA